MLNFVIPIRHPKGVLNKELQYRTLAEAFGLISASTDADYKCFVVVNEEQVLPDMPQRFQRVDVKIPFDERPEQFRSASEIHSIIRQDKGLRVAAAFKYFDHSEYMMVVDDDDFISRNLVSFINENIKDKKLWVIDKGYGWKSGAASAYYINQFYRICGASLILPAENYYFSKSYKNSNSSSYFQAITEFGSHRIIVTEGVKNGVKFDRVPFRTAVYRRGHENSEETNIAKLRASLHSTSPYLYNLRSWKNSMKIKISEICFERKPRILWEHRVRRWQKINKKHLEVEFSLPS